MISGNPLEAITEAVIEALEITLESGNLQKGDKLELSFVFDPYFGMPPNTEA